MKKVISVLLAVLLVFVQLVAFTGCQKQTKFSKYYFEYFDTATTVVGYTQSQEEFDAICTDIEALFKEYHRLFTIYDRYENLNNLTTINDTDNGQHNVVTVDKKIIDMLLFCKEMYVKTNGKVNVAMGSVLKIWHEYRNAGLDDPANAQLPPMDKLQEAAKHTNIDDVIIDEVNSTVFLADPQMSLDVGAIAKGYAAEKVAQFLEEKGITGFILNVGGNIRTIGMAVDKPWNIGIENPDTASDQAYIEYMQLVDKSLVTSGNYQRFYVVNGESYHHIIDPVTLVPGTNFNSVSVVTDDSGFGDAMSTALFLMSYEEGLQFVESIEGTDAMWVMPDGQQKYSSGFKNYCTDNLA